MKEFTDQLLSTFEVKEKEIFVTIVDELIAVSELKKICVTMVNELKRKLANHQFKSEEEEIYFFKECKPKLASKLIYYCQLSTLLRSKPFKNSEESMLFFKRKQKQLIKRNAKYHDLLIYYYSGASYHDQFYFLRKHLDTSIVPHHSLWNETKSIATNKDYLLAILIANLDLLQYLEQRLSKPHEVTEININGSPMTWTGTKVEFVELIYGLASSTVINNGQVEIKELSRQLCLIFNISLPNQYRTFSEIKNRKNRVLFLNQMAVNLEAFLDKTDI